DESHERRTQSVQLLLELGAFIARETRPLERGFLLPDLTRRALDEFRQIRAAARREADVVLREPLDRIVAEAAEPGILPAREAGVDADLILIDSPRDPRVLETLGERRPLRFALVHRVFVHQ